ncbi:MAG: ketoacyl-ACP synthase III [Rickettsiales bacterium]|jgi:3-oxoacyl-[acyl-carrier-protein] synthase-3|nr:ketoacyl-ACP synthase III [Rickettsiales bacterium]
MLNSKIVAVSSYLPEKVYDNGYLESIVNTSDEWIRERTGIVERHIASDGEFTTDLAVRAVQKLLEKVDIAVNDIDAIVFATTTPDRTFPSCASILHGKLDMTNDCCAFDVQAVCCGFLYALDMADSMVKLGKAKNVLVVGAETMSRIVDWKDRNTCILFGDGAGALLLGPSSDDSSGIIATNLYCNGRYSNILRTSGGVSLNGKAGFIEMQGKEVFRIAVGKMYDCLVENLEKCNLTIDDIDFLIPHQANQRLINSMASRLNLPSEKMVSTLAMHGNTSSASIPLAMDYILDHGQGIEKGNTVVLCAVGGGITWGSAVIRW